MKKLVIHLVVGLALFVGALVGGLAATGRLNHEGTANIPILSGFFPEPPKAEGEGEAGAEHGAPADGHGAPADAHAAPAGETKAAVHEGAAGTPVEASAGGEEDPQGEEKPRRSKDGKSVVEPEKPAGGDGHGGGHGEAPAEGGHGEEAKDGHGEAAKDEHGAEKPGPKKDPKKAGGHATERDFEHRSEMLAGDRKNKYTPGGYFTFDGMPAGLTPEQLNEAWQRVKVVLADLEKRAAVLDQREQQLQALADDIDRRQRRVAELRIEIENEKQKLDERILQFQSQVKMIRNDEVAALKRNAATYASFGPTKVAELFAEMWRTEKGQEEVLKILEFMDKDVANEALNAMANPVVQEILKKRLNVAKEPAAPAGPTK